MDSPGVRAVLAVFLLLAGLLAIRFAWARRTVGAAARPAAGGAVCLAVEGATRRPGLRCVERATVGEAAPAAPCADGVSRRRLRELLARCPAHGRLLVLAPLRRGGRCEPRLEPLPAALRILLGIPIELSGATRADLEALPGVGPRTAAAILEARDGRRSLEELADVRGVGAERLERLRRLLTLEASPPGCR